MAQGAKEVQVMSSKYFLFDGRWFSDPDSSAVLCTADTIEEAIDDYTAFPDDTVIVNVAGVAAYCHADNFNITGR